MTTDGGACILDASPSNVPDQCPRSMGCPLPTIELIQTTYVSDRGTCDATPESPFVIRVDSAEADRLVREGFARYIATTRETEAIKPKRRRGRPRKITPPRTSDAG